LIKINENTPEFKLILYLVIAGSLVRGPLIDETCTKCLYCEFHGLGDSSKICTKAEGYLTSILKLHDQLRLN